MSAAADPLDVVLGVIESDRCACEYVDIGVGMQRVTNDPECPQHSRFGLAGAIVDALATAGLLAERTGATS